jgi:hypothetical protein
MAVNSSVWGISTALIYKELQKRFFAKPISQTDYIQPDENLQQISSLYKP